MAAPGSAFKMKCPSCEAGVTIRDASLVGKKIECPKCKFRFIIEAQSDTAASTLETPAAKKSASGATSSASGTVKPKPADAAAKSSKNKPLPKREEDEEEEEVDDESGEEGLDGKKKKKKKNKKKSGSNTTVLIGGGIGILAIALLAIGYFAGLFDDGDSSSSGKTSKQITETPKKVDTPIQVVPPKVDLPVAKQFVPKEAPVDIVYGDITNWLPEDAEWVLRVNVPELVKSPVGAVIFDDSADAAKSFLRSTGFRGSDVERLTCAGNKDGSFFGVVRFNKEIKFEDMQAAMQFEPLPVIIGRRGLFPAKPNELFKMLADFYTVKTKGLSLPKFNNSPMAVAIPDARTLVIADQPVLERFLRNDFKRKFRTNYIRPDPAAPTAKADEKKDAAPKSDQPDASKKDARPSFTSNPTFLSVDPGLKVMMNQLDDEKAGVITLAYRMPNAEAVFRQLNGSAPAVAVPLPDSPIIGLTVRKMDDYQLDVGGAIEFDRSEDAIRSLNLLQPLLGTWAQQLTTIFQVGIGVNTLEVDFESAVAMANTSASFLSPFTGSPRELFRTTPDHEQLTIRPRDAFRQDGQPDILPATPLRNHQVLAPVDPKDLPTSSRIIAWAKDRYLMFRLNVLWNPVYHEHISPSIRSHMDLMKGEALMLTGQAYWHTLAKGIKAIEKAGVVPPGAFPRPPDPARFGVPFPPDQRVSWMADLLPSLGYEVLTRIVRRDEAWNSTDNLTAGSHWIPEFLSRDFPPSAWRAQVPSLKGRELAATQFVGVTGIGADAANYPDTPEFSKKLGMLGYNRQTKFADVTDGLSNTIFMIQVPPNVQRPWIRGGGSTLQGVPETSSVKPFVSTSRNGKKGTYVLMADGSIRFISETIDDKLFQALTTYKGDEKIDNLDTLAPALKVEAKLEGVPKN